MRKQAGLLMLVVGLLRGQGPQKLTLQEAEAIALKNHPQVGAARFTAAASEQVITQTRSNLYPTVVGSVSGAGALSASNLAAGGLSSPSIPDKFATGTLVNQLITDFGRTSHLIESSRLRAAADQSTLQDARARVLLQVDRAYLNVLRAQAVLRIASRTVAARQLIADQVGELAKSSLKSGLDVSFANVNLAEAKLLLASAQNAQQAAFADLTAALGSGTVETYELADVPVPPELLDAPSQYLGEALQARPDLQAQRLSQQSATQLVEAEKALRFPSISAVAGVGLVPAHDERLRGQYAAGGLNVTLPILNGHLFTARKNEVVYRALASGQTVRDLENRIARDVKVAWLDANTAYQRIGLTAELLNQANLALELAQARYDLGLSSIVELSQAQLNQTAAAIQNTQAKYDYQLQWTALQYQGGRLR